MNWYTRVKIAQVFDFQAHESNPNGYLSQDEESAVWTNSLLNKREKQDPPKPLHINPDDSGDLDYPPLTDEKKEQLQRIMDDFNQGTDFGERIFQYIEADGTTKDGPNDDFSDNVTNALLMFLSKRFNATVTENDIRLEDFEGSHATWLYGFEYNGMHFEIEARPNGMLEIIVYSSEEEDGEVEETAKIPGMQKLQ